MADTSDIPPKPRRELLKPNGRSEERSKELRRTMSLPEVLLWNQLKANKTGYSFRRQQPMGPFIADFYCHELLFVVEVDGEFHQLQRDEDGRRDAWMRERGVDVLRLAAKFVLDDPGGAAARVAAVGRERAAKLKARRGAVADNTTLATPGLEDSATPSASAEGDL